LPPVLINRAKFGAGQIAAFGDYKPWSWHKMEVGDFSNYPQYSGRILDIKQAKPAAVAFFVERIAPELGDNVAIAIVPSHDPAKPGLGLGMLAAELAKNGSRIDASACLVRTKKIDKLALGGDRSVEVHLQSISVARHIERLGIDTRRPHMSQYAPACKNSRNWLAVAFVHEVRSAARCVFQDLM